MSNMMTAVAKNRIKDALQIQQGGSNPSGVARALVQAINACNQNGTNAAEDPALRLFVRQLSHLCGTWKIFHDLDVHAKLIARCERAKEGNAALQTQRSAS
ncbi:hypothetical protein PWR05_35260 [Paraburkholderia sp. A2RI-6]|uniref:hypothetical protein n=1 Tax=Paraburkholderia sp. A2RI-6 TaxID=3028371 RepID=UPI003B7A6996